MTQGSCSSKHCRACQPPAQKRRCHQPCSGAPGASAGRSRPANAIRRKRSGPVHWATPKPARPSGRVLRVFLSIVHSARRWQCRIACICGPRGVSAAKVSSGRERRAGASVPPVPRGGAHSRLRLVPALRSGHVGHRTRSFRQPGHPSPGAALPRGHHAEYRVASASLSCHGGQGPPLRSVRSRGAARP